MSGQNSATTSNYVFDNNGDHSVDQHHHLAELLDPLTFERLGQTGVTDGWDCLEVGAGGGSVALWLAERVAPTGRVLATDIEPGLIPRRPGLTVAQHDIVNDPLPESAFDLAHARFVLSHLPRRQQVLERLRATLRPGGWLQIDEIDITHWVAPPTPDPRARELYGAYVAAMAQVLGAAGSDPTWGGSAARAVAEAGLVEVDAVRRTETWGFGSPGIGLLISNSLHLEDRFLEAGMTRSQLRDVREVMADREFRTPSFAVHSILARRPS
jgi:SAM-dependent methyltransferase